MTNNDNPILTNNSLPLFDEIKAEHVVPGITTLLEEASKKFEELEKTVTADWETSVPHLEKIGDRLGTQWTAVSHLKAVKDTAELREAVEKVQPAMVKFGLKTGQSTAMYKAYRSIKDNANTWNGLTEVQQRIITSSLLEAENSGVGLEGDKKERFNQISEELTKLSTDFSNNVLDATKAYKKIVTSRETLAGVPASSIEMFAENYNANVKAENEKNKTENKADATAAEGPYLLSLDYPSFHPIITYADSQSLREELYRAYQVRASEGDRDNTPMINKILKLRNEKAQILGYANHAELSMSSKMATLDKARELLEELRLASFEAAKQDLLELQGFAKEKGLVGELRHWDAGYYAEKLKEERYNLNEEELKQYFAFPKVLDGLFRLLERVFEVKVVAADGEATVWHKDVKYFKIMDKSDVTLAYFYCDAYARPEEKRGGAWMNEVVGKSSVCAGADGEARIPIAHIVCNQTPPIGDKPSLMTFRDVETLFHETGHALQHMLTNVTDGFAAGISGVEWDAVELPSQMMENFCYDKSTLDSFAAHIETGEKLPEEMFKQLVAARTFRAGSGFLRQLLFSTVDLDLHSTYDPEGELDIWKVYQKVAEKNSILPPLPTDRFLCSFSHIFAGGYSAGYFSYKWAEVLSADAFSAFEEVLDDEAALKEVGLRFRNTVLGMGGGRDPALVFKDFRGRDPSIKALLRHNGLVVNNSA